MGLKVEGIIPAMVTPMDKNQEIDAEGMKAVINYLIDAGVHGIFVSGSQGEACVLTDEEKKKIIKLTVDEVNGRVPVYAGTGAISTRDVIRMSRYAADVGADAVSIVTPYYISPSQEELYWHYRRIAEAVDIPVLLYNNPSRTNVNLEGETVRKLAQLDNVVGIKDSSGDLTLTAEYIRSCPDSFSVLAGRDSLILATLLYGGKGAIAATANIAPKLVTSIYENYMRGNLEKARESQLRLLRLRLAFKLGTFPIVVKEAMNLLGRPAGPTRSPVAPLSEEKRGDLKALLIDLGLLHP